MDRFKDEVREWATAFQDQTQGWQEQSRAEMSDWRTAFQSQTKEWQESLQADMSARDEKSAADLAAWREENRQETRRLNKQLGEIANKQGRMAEDLAAPSICRILKEVLRVDDNEICVSNVRVRRRHPDGKSVREFDVIAECGEVVLVNETKSTLSPADVDHLLKTLTDVKTYFPEYRHRRLMGSVATLYVDESLVTYASSKGILVLAVGDELMDVMNPPGFTPRQY